MRAYKLALRRAEKHLAAVDRRMAAVIARHGRCALVPAWERSPYESLLRAVAHQQLHARAAEAILGRLAGHFPGKSFPEPADILSLSLEEMRACGFSLSKATTLRGIAEGALQGVIPTRAAADVQTDEQLIAELTSLRGIGRWTVEMLLIFTLARLDVMPVDDFGVKSGLQAVYKLENFPGKADFARLTEAWQPYRSIGAWYLWREADHRKLQAKTAAKPLTQAASPKSTGR